MKRIRERVPWFLLMVLLIALIPLSKTINNIGTGLVDWRDYPFIVWVMEQNVTDIKNFNFSNLANTNAYYPLTGTRYLSDLLLPQSVFMVPLSFVSKNIILNFNVVFVLTIMLNIVSTYYFWFFVFKDKKLAAVGSFLTSFSPFFHSNINHFQMITFWPFFAGLSFLFKETLKTKNYAIAGIFIAVQFLASAYLGVFMAFVVVTHAIVSSLNDRNLSFVKHSIVAIAVFLLLDGVFVKGYLGAKSQFEIVRDYREYIIYSAHVADYLFPKMINSIFYRLPVFGDWNALSGHFGEAANFPGFSVTTLALIALIYVKQKKEISFGIRLGRTELLFLLLIVFGFVFSLGPRLQFNGNYDHLPLPYHFIVKYAPLVNSIRTPGRWSFILYVGLIYFALKTLGKIKNKIAYGAICLFILAEYLPTQIPNESQSYIDKNDVTLSTICAKRSLVALQIPVTHFDVKGGIVEGLSYITKEELASLFHGCRIVNGYSGYDLPYIQSIKNDIYDSLNQNLPDKFIETVNRAEADIFVVNRQFILNELENNLQPTLDLFVKTGRIKSISPDVYQIIK